MSEEIECCICKEEEDGDLYCELHGNEIFEDFLPYCDGVCDW